MRRNTAVTLQLFCGGVMEINDLLIKAHERGVCVLNQDPNTSLFLSNVHLKTDHLISQNPPTQKSIRFSFFKVVSF